MGQQQQGDLAGAKKVFCFYDIQDDFRPQDLNPCLCTHVVYSYVAVRKNLSFIAGKKGEFGCLLFAFTLVCNKPGRRVDGPIKVPERRLYASASARFPLVPAVKRAGGRAGRRTGEGEKCHAPD